MCFVDNAIRDPVCGDHPFAAATTTHRRPDESGTTRSAAYVSISIGLFSVKIAIVRRTKRGGITNAIKGSFLLADVVLTVELRKPSFAHTHTHVRLKFYILSK